MILSFKDRGTEDIYDRAVTRAACRTCPQALWPVARRKLEFLDTATSLGDLASPPGNRLEALNGDRNDQYSVRVNSRYRIFFVWTPQGPTSVEIVDYH